MQTVLLIIETLGFIAFSASAAMIAINHETDLFGVILMSITTCFGGGLMRDVLIGNILPVFFTSYWQIGVCVVTAVIVFIIAARFKRQFVNNEEVIDKIINYVDAAGIGLFAVAGTKICMDLGYGAFVSVTMGAFTCFGGSMIRDVCLGEVPFVLRKRIYAVAALLGSAVYYLLEICEINEIVATVVGALVVFGIRVAATIFKLNMPKAIIFSELRQDCETESATPDACDENRR